MRWNNVAIFWITTLQVFTSIHSTARTLRG